MKLILLVLSLLIGASTASAANMRVSFRNSNDRYMSAEGGGGSHLYANRIQAREWERFLIVDLNRGSLVSGDQVCIETWNRHYVVAEGGGGSVVRANRTGCGPWEKFYIHKLNDQGQIISGEIAPGTYIALQAANRQFVAVERDRNGSVVANRNAVGLWERFVIFAW